MVAGSNLIWGNRDIFFVSVADKPSLSFFMYLWLTSAILLPIMCRSYLVNAPIDSVPLFVVAGSVIPILDPRVQTMNNATNSSVVTWQRMKVHVQLYI